MTIQSSLYAKIPMCESIDEQVSEIQERIESLETRLPVRLEPLALSRSKLPFKALAFQSALAWRIMELAPAALAAFNTNKIAVAMLLTRGAVETTAGLWYLRKKITTALERGALGDLDDYLMRLYGGTRNWDETAEAINVLNFVDVLDKAVPGAREQYEGLCEYAHPNYSGVIGLYSKTDRQNFLLDFGPNIGGSDSHRRIGIPNLSNAVMLFEHAYDEVEKAMPDFIVLCEKHIQSAA